jgi:hypothetical protein
VFVQKLTLAAAGIGLGLNYATGFSASSGQGIYRIAPIPGRGYSEGFLRMCRERRFSSASDAMMGVRNEDLEFLIIRA